MGTGFKHVHERFVRTLQLVTPLANMFLVMELPTTNRQPVIGGDGDPLP